MRKLIGLAVLVGLPFTGQAAEVQKEVTLRSLLQEMADRDALARLPVYSYSCRQSASHDRQQTDLKNAQTWFANKDYEQCIRIEENEGRKEWVIMDDKGPGAVTRFWTPLLADRDRQIIRFYFDGASTPAIAVPFNEFLSGRGFVKPPLAFISWNESDLRNQRKPEFKGSRGIGGDLYLPIPFAKGCKITLDSLPFYYVINYRIYEAGTPVKTFLMADYEAATAAVEQAGTAMLTDAAADAKAKTKSKQATLRPGEELAIDLPRGAAAVRNLSVKLGPGADGQALRSVVLTANFDGEPTIWCPLSEFFGAGVRTNTPVRDWCRMVSADGKLESRWVMPYRKSAGVGLKNTGKVPVTVELSVETGKWKWDDRSMYFHASWRCQNGFATIPRSDWNYIDIQGMGLYVGDTLTVFSPVGAWYGEGDERVYVDGEAFPSHMGTGTEDYYGYAWGMAGYFSSPYISMPKRDFVKQDDWRGYTTTSRMRILDAIPIKTALKFDMEIWNWANTKVDYAAGMFWYACPGAKCNRTPQPEEAAAPLSEVPEAYKIPGAVECEKMKVHGKSEGLNIGTQDAGLTEGKWSDEKHLFVQASKVGDYVELEIPAGDNQPHKLTIYATKSSDYGIIKFSVDGQQIGQDCDMYAPKAVASGPVELGTITPKDGKLILKAEVVGANAGSKGKRYFFGLDCVVMGK